jgi:hypothetical protein
MIQAVCKNVRLSDALDTEALYLFSEVVNPLDYEYSLELGSKYCIIGIEIDKLLVYAYCFNCFDKSKNYAYPFVSRYPLCLFDLIETKNRTNYDLVIAEGKISLQEKFLSDYGNWFESYVDGDQKIEMAIGHYFEKNID